MQTAARAQTSPLLPAALPLPLLLPLPVPLPVGLQPGVPRLPGALVLQGVARAAQQGHLYRILLHYLHFLDNLLCDGAGLPSCLHCGAVYAGFYYLLHNERSWNSFLFMGSGGAQSKREEVQEEIFHILEQLQYHHGPVLHDWPRYQDYRLHYLWRTVGDLHPQLGRQNSLGNSLHVCHHKNHQNWNCFKVLWPDNPEHQRDDEGRVHVPDNLLRDHAGLLLRGLLHVQLSPGPGEEEFCGGLQHPRRVYLLLLGVIAGIRGD